MATRQPALLGMAPDSARPVSQGTPPSVSWGLRPLYLISTVQPFVCMRPGLDEPVYFRASSSRRGGGSAQPNGARPFVHRDDWLMMATTIEACTFGTLEHQPWAGELQRGEGSCVRSGPEEDPGNDAPRAGSNAPEY